MKIAQIIKKAVTFDESSIVQERFTLQPSETTNPFDIKQTDNSLPPINKIQRKKQYPVDSSSSQHDWVTQIKKLFHSPTNIDLQFHKFQTVHRSGTLIYLNSLSDKKDMPNGIVPASNLANSFVSKEINLTQAHVLLISSDLARAA